MGCESDGEGGSHGVLGNQRAERLLDGSVVEARREVGMR